MTWLYALFPNLCFLRHYIFRSKRFIFFAVFVYTALVASYITTSSISVLTCVLVLCPLTGRFIACLFPLYVPIACNRFIFPVICRLRSLSIVISERSFAKPLICPSPRLFIRCVLWIWKRAIRPSETLGPTP